MQPDVSIIVVNWHSGAYVTACAESIRDETTSRYELIVVDNASHDGCLEMLALRFPDAIRVQSPSNLGFAAANNLGLQHATGEFVLFLNPDTVILDGAIDKMVDAMRRRPWHGPLGARLLNTDGSVQTSCVQALPTLLNQLLAAEVLMRTFPRSDLWKVNALVSPVPDVVPVDAVSGACLMLPATLCRELGGFSEVFFMYGEDIDLCTRIRSLGHRVGHLSTAVITHHGGGSSRTQPSASAIRMMQYSLETYFRRNRGPAVATGYRLTTLLAALLRLSLLGVSFPAWLAAGRRHSWRQATAKWLVVLRWTCSPRPAF